MKSATKIQYIRIILILLPSLIFVHSQFDYQVGARSQDAISNFLSYIRKSAAVPYTVVRMGKANITDQYEGGPKILFPSASADKEYPSTWSYGLENGYAFIYYAGVPSVAFTISNGTGRVPIWEEHKYHPVTGAVLTATGRTKAYDVIHRPWYSECKAANKTIWVKPYFTSTLSPAVAFTQPFYNLKINGRFYPGVSGVLAMEASLNGINDYLKKVYGLSKYDVFLMEKSTYNIIGSSWGADSYRAVTATTRQYIKATDSLDTTIKSAALKLIEKGFTKDLFVMGDKYVQCDTYVDSVPGIEWYVVVLMPATVELDHLGDSSSLYNAVLIIASLATAVTFSALCATLFFLRTRLIRLTRPMFTITVLTGGLMVLAYCYLLLGENETNLCAARPWVFNLSFTFAFSPLLIKAWRVHIMFNVNPLSKNKLVSNMLLFSYTMGLVVVDAVILAITLYGVGDGTKPKTDLVLSSYGAYAEMTYCSYTFNNAFFYAEVFYKGFLILTACILSFLIRKIAGTIAGSKSLLIIVYNIGFVSVVVLTIGQSISSVATRIFLQVVGICFCVMVTAFVLVWPTFYELITVGDNAAADDVLNEVFDGSRGKQTSSGKPSASQNFTGFRRASASAYSVFADKRHSAVPSTVDNAHPARSTKVQQVHVAPIHSGNVFSELEAKSEANV